ncbi:MAG: hypothetical protein JWN48_1705 [Myxococcaceae bacterium]|nr:hypothetical protein [Myxococcaceae bacterium]
MGEASQGPQEVFSRVTWSLYAALGVVQPAGALRLGISVLVARFNSAQ